MISVFIWTCATFDIIGYRAFIMGWNGVNISRWSVTCCRTVLIVGGAVIVETILNIIIILASMTIWIIRNSGNIPTISIIGVIELCMLWCKVVSPSLIDRYLMKCPIDYVFIPCTTFIFVDSIVRPSAVRRSTPPSAYWNCFFILGAQLSSSGKYPTS